MKNGLLKVFNFKKLGAEMGATFKRFPIACIIWILLFLTIFNPAYKGKEIEFDLVHYGIALFLYGLVHIIISVIYETNRMSGWKYWGLHLIGLVVTGIIMFPFIMLDNPIFSYLPNTDNQFNFRFSSSQVSIASFVLFLHLGIAALPFRNKSITHWAFNIAILTRVVQGVIISTILLIGLLLAVYSVQVLFDLQFQIFYERILLSVYLVFQTWYILSGIPKVNELIIDKDAGQKDWLLKVVRFAIAPLFIVYFVILFIYTLKIAVSWDLPRGMVSLPILLYCLFGGLLFLLLYWEQSNSKLAWVKWISKFFFLSLPPFLILLAISIYVRIDQYGITWPRFIVINVLFWLVAMDILFITKPNRNINIIPFSLLANLLFLYMIPYKVSVETVKWSQKKRLFEFFEKYHSVKEGKLIALPNSVSSELRDSMLSVYDAIPDLDSNTIREYVADTIVSRIIAETKKDLIGKDQDEKFRFSSKFVSNLGNYLIRTSLDLSKDDKTENKEYYYYQVICRQKQNNWAYKSRLEYFREDIFYMQWESESDTVVQVQSESNINLDDSRYLELRKTSHGKLRFIFSDHGNKVDTVIDLGKAAELWKAGNFPRDNYLYIADEPYTLFSIKTKWGAELIFEMTSYEFLEKGENRLNYIIHYSPPKIKK